MLNIMLLYCDEVNKHQKLNTTLPIRIAKDIVHHDDKENENTSSIVEIRNVEEKI